MIVIEELESVLKRLLEMRDILDGRDDMRLSAYLVEMAVLDISESIALRKSLRLLTGAA